MSLANSYVAESTLAATTDTITFPWPAREVQITNDSTQHNLQFKLNSSESYRTLKPYETCTITNARCPELFISSSASVPYRIWGLG